VTALVVEPEEVAAIAAALARAPLVAFDLEFLAQERLVPTLCLIQVAWTHHEAFDAAVIAGASADPEVKVALIDPLAVDARPIVDAIAAHARAVAHAARQDLQLLAARFGVSVRGIADTQVMAAFAGLGDQIGLAGLAGELAGATLGKELQWTDWAKRPLDPAQIAYAAADVRYLPQIYVRLAARLGERVAWALAESAEVAAEAEAAARVTPETAWREVGGGRGLDAAAFAVMIALAAWRQRTAIELDRPIGQVMNDRTLVELARQRPRSAEAVRGARGMSPIGKQRASEIADAIADAPPAEVASPPAWRPPSARAQRWAEVLLAITQLAAERLGVAARLLATRADAEAFTRAVDERGLPAAEALPALATWRRPVLGELWIGWLTGALALVGDPEAPSGLGLIPRPVEPA
jgi:ribonuclease D